MNSNFIFISVALFHISLLFFSSFFIMFLSDTFSRILDVKENNNSLHVISYTYVSSLQRAIWTSPTKVTNQHNVCFSSSLPY